MSINCASIHTRAGREETVNLIKDFLESKGYFPVVPEEYIPELSGIDYNRVEEKNLRFFVVTKNLDGWTGIFEDGGIFSQKELAEYISLNLSTKVIWSLCSGSTCNFMYTVFDNGEIAEELARGDAYDYDEKGQLKYFEFYDENSLLNFLKNQEISTATLTYEDFMSNSDKLHLSKDDFVHIAFQREKAPEIVMPSLEDILGDDDEEEEDNRGFFKKMMDKVTQPIMGTLGNQVGKFLPQIQKAQEMNQLLKPLLEQGLKGDALRNHPNYIRIKELEKEIKESVKNSPFYSEEMGDMFNQGGGITDKLLKAYDPLEEEIKNLTSGGSSDFKEMAQRGKKVIELSAGIKIDMNKKGLKRLDKALSWSGVPKDADENEFKIAVGSLIGEIIIGSFGGKWLKTDLLQNSIIATEKADINPFIWYDEKISGGEAIYKKFSRLEE